MEIAIQVLRTANSLEAAGRRAFKDQGITPAQFNVLNVVADSEAGVPFMAVAEQLLVDRSNVTGLVKKLVADGLLTVSGSEADRRQKILQLTAQGRRIWRKTNEVYQKGLDDVSKALGSKEIEMLVGALRKVEETANRLNR